MNKIKILLICFIVILISCEKKPAPVVGNRHLGKLPVIANNSTNKAKKHQKAYENAIKKMDRKAGLKALDELKEIEKNTEAKMDLVFREKGSFEFPFEQKINRDKYLIKKITVTGAHCNLFKRNGNIVPIIHLEAVFEPVDEIKGNLSLFLRFVDKNGNKIKGFGVLNYFGKPLKKIEHGKTYSFKGSYSGLENLINADNITILSRADWNKNRHK